jgi:hypothetical protein
MSGAPERQARDKCSGSFQKFVIYGCKKFYKICLRLLSGAPVYGRLLALPTNISLGWKGWPGNNALAYYEKL